MSLKNNGSHKSTPHTQALLEPQLKLPLSSNGKLESTEFSHSEQIPTLTRRQKALRFWDNLNLQTKLTILLVVAAGVPVIVVTQGLVWFSQQNAQKTLQETVKANSDGFSEDYVQWPRDESKWQANTIAKTVEAAEINLQNPGQVRLYRSFLETLVSSTYAPQDTDRPDTYKSIRIITNAEGKTVAQYIRAIQDYPLGNPPPSTKIFKTVSLPTGIDLGDVPIVQNAIRTGRPLRGIELLESNVLQRLGLAKQATVQIQSQPPKYTQQASLDGNYPSIEQGRAGLVAMAVQPIKERGRVTGVALVGTLLNRSHPIVDGYNSFYGSAAAVFAQNIRISTTVSEEDGKTRALGTRAPSQVVVRVLEGGESFVGEENILGKKYLTAYAPLFDHQKLLNPSKAKPVGMTFIAITPEKVEEAVGRLQLIGYSIGGIILLVSTLR